MGKVLSVLLSWGGGGKVFMKEEKVVCSSQGGYAGENFLKEGRRMGLEPEVLGRVGQNILI